MHISLKYLLAFLGSVLFFILTGDGSETLLLLIGILLWIHLK